MLIVVLKALERFEHGQVSFAAGQTLGAPAAAEPHRLLVIFQRSHERFDECRLATAGLSRDHHQTRATAPRTIEFLKERLQLQITTHDRTGRARSARKHRDR